MIISEEWIHYEWLSHAVKRIYIFQKSILLSREKEEFDCGQGWWLQEVEVTTFLPSISYSHISFCCTIEYFLLHKHWLRLNQRVLASSIVPVLLPMPRFSCWQPPKIVAILHICAPSWGDRLEENASCNHWVNKKFACFTARKRISREPSLAYCTRDVRLLDPACRRCFCTSPYLHECASKVRQFLS